MLGWVALSLGFYQVYLNPKPDLKTPSVGKIMDQPTPRKATIPHTCGVQVDPKHLSLSSLMVLFNFLDCVGPFISRFAQSLLNALWLRVQGLSDFLGFLSSGVLESFACGVANFEGRVSMCALSPKP